MMERIQDLTELRGKKVFVRANYNVPMDNGKIVDNERIVASLETINFLLENEASVVIASHLGRPDGVVDPNYSLRPIAKELEKLIKKSVHFVPDCVGEQRDKAITEAKSGDVLLLENTRFHPEEMTNDSLFSQRLARGCDLYVNDAFPDSHRAHASVVGVASSLRAYAGLALQREVDGLTRLVTGAEKPFVLISGGAKVSDKLGILENMLDRVDTLLIGGGMANTFLCSQKIEVGCSLYEEDFVKKASEITNDARQKGIKIVLPKDVVITKAVSENAKGLTVPITEVGDLDIIVDLGPETIASFEREIASAKTIFWNGSLGIAEYPNFAKATLAIGSAIARASAYSAIGGGDTIAAISEEVKDKFSFVSMAGGASMEFLEGKALPGLVILEK